MDQAFLFIDSNILLHYKFLYEIDWRKIVAAEAVELIIPCTVISTLDQKKYDSADSAVRERARKTIEKFLRHTQGSQIRQNVTLNLLDHEPETEFAQRGLSLTSEDDRIIAEVLLYREEYPDRQIAVVTADAGLTLKCKRRGIPALEIPEDYRLPDRLDAQTKRIRELEATVLELQNMQPRLSVTFANRQNYAEFQVREPQTLSEQQIQEQIEKISAAVDPKLREANRRVTLYDTLPVEMAAAKEFLKAYRTYLETMNAYNVYCCRTIELGFLLVNDGNASAEDTDVYIEAQGRFSIAARHQSKPKQPPLPTQRAKRGPFSDFDFDQMNESIASIVPLAEQIKPRNVSDATINQTTAGQSVHFNVRRIKQGTSLPLKTLFATFPSLTEALSFGLKYTINSHSLPNNLTGELHVKIERP